ncbi:MAG: molybdopterin molybdotransferase MoeA [candidate division KSB1 bacterium]|nr:molybdopterin molybdotransferase MoeA [candidate division KSB1 bacterium]
MVTIEEAVRLVRENLPPRRTEILPLLDAGGRVLARRVVAPEPAPRYTNAAMDGFAVRWSDVEPALHGRPVVLQVIGESQAGSPFGGTVEQGQAVRISTGAMLPQGADTVVPVEDTQANKGTVTVVRADRQGQHVRLVGEDIAEGEILFEPGVELTPPRLAALAALGIREVEAFSEPRVALLITGNELVAEEAVAPWQIHDANGPMLELVFRALGAKVVRRTRTQDQPEAIAQAIAAGYQEADLVVLTGGVSVGPHDYVKAAASAAGFQPIFWRVWQKPGKPLFVASCRNCLLMGLPGNPVSAFVCAVYYLAPAIRWLRGGEFGWDLVSARLAQAVTNSSERPTFFQARTRRTSDGQMEIVPHAKQGSHILTSIAHANSMFLVAAETGLPAGTAVQAILYPWEAQHA